MLGQFRSFATNSKQISIIRDQFSTNFDHFQSILNQFRSFVQKNSKICHNFHCYFKILSISKFLNFKFRQRQNFSKPSKNKLLKTFKIEPLSIICSKFDQNCLCLIYVSSNIGTSKKQYIH